jgi:hypothetical protein
MSSNIEIARNCIDFIDNNFEIPFVFVYCWNTNQCVTWSSNYYMLNNKTELLVLMNEAIKIYSSRWMSDLLKKLKLFLNFIL